jgi:hypothetical protein
VESVSALADAGMHVLAVAGRQHAVERGLRGLAETTPRIRPFGFTDRVPELMAAADVVVALPGATTCSEARVVGRQLLLLDVMPGHGRDNLLHELELGAAHVCRPTPGGVAASASALRDEAPRPAARASTAGRPVPRWEPPFVAALQRIGLDLRPPDLDQRPAGPASIPPQLGSPAADPARGATAHDAPVTRGVE